MSVLTRFGRPHSPDGPARVPGRPRHARPFIVGELIIAFALIKVYDYIRSLETARAVPAREHGQDVLSLERHLGLDWEHAINTWTDARHAIWLLSAYWYQFCNITVTFAVLAWCYISGPGVYRQARNALVASNIIGMTVFFFFPVMPPRLLPGEGFIDLVAQAGFGSNHGGPVTADQYAAMPSMHVAWALWTAMVAVALLPRLGRWRYLCYLYPLITAFVIIGTANHYVLDGCAGVVVAVATVWFTGLFRPLGSAPMNRLFRTMLGRPAPDTRSDATKTDTAPSDDGDDPADATSRHPIAARAPGAVTSSPSRAPEVTIPAANGKPAAPRSTEPAGSEGEESHQ